MKALKTILISVYVIIIILLLLSLLRCEHKTVRSREAEPNRDTLVHKRDTIPEKVVIKEKFKADVVMCIDCTSSMNNIINTIKKNALTFYPDLKQKCISQGKEITSMRIKVIGFRDINDTTPFEKSSFYDIPAKEDDFKKFVSHLSPFGGDDAPEHGYDALAMAINSDWKKGNDVHQIIILWTDNASHPLSGRNGVPMSLTELTSLWKEKMSNKGKRLILFAPADNSWTTLEHNWDKTTRHDVSTGGGLSDVDYEEILKTLSERM